MNKDITSMFNIPIMKIYITDWYNKKSKLLEELNHRENLLTKSNSIITDFFKPSKNNFAENFFKEEIEELEKLTGAKFNVCNGWFEISHLHHFHGIHNHSPIGYSAVCYINFLKNLHSSLYFVAPFTNFLNGNTLDYSPEIEEGTIIFFPSAILHYTLPNKIEEKRIVYSFNLTPVQYYSDWDNR